MTNDTKRYWAIAGKRFGYALDVYPEEAIRYRANLRQALGRGVVVLGEFAARQEAEQCVVADLRSHEQTRKGEQ
jgi:hypothetical protein